MNGDDDYLWNRTGRIDPEIAALERLLAPQAWRPVPRARLRTASRTRPARRRRLLWALAASISACTLALAGWLQYRLSWPADAAWPVLASAGTVTGLDTGRRAVLSVGEEIGTGQDGVVRLRIARIGELRLAPESRIRLEETRSGRHRLRLLQGELHARVWAPPQQFGMTLPGAELWDLGCEFVVRSDASGNGMLIVRSGWVLLDDGIGEVLVPQGGQVRLAAGAPVGTPHDLGASADFVAALREVDARAATIDASDPAVLRLVRQARAEDAISLLSLLQRQPRLAQGPLFDRLREALPQAGVVTRAAVVRGERAALQPWWDALPYPRAKQWWWQWRDAWPSDGSGMAVDSR